MTIDVTVNARRALLLADIEDDAAFVVKVLADADWRGGPAARQVVLDTGDKVVLRVDTTQVGQIFAEILGPIYDVILRNWRLKLLERLLAFNAMREREIQQQVDEQVARFREIFSFQGCGPDADDLAWARKTAEETLLRAFVLRDARG